MGIKTSFHQNREIHFDLLRIIACFCVIVIHVPVYSQRELWAPNSYENLVINFYGILSRWAVPCFVMLSGMLFLDRNKQIPLKKLYGKYILRLAVSYVFWSCCYALFNMNFETDGTISEKIKYFINNCFSGEIHMWYVLMIIGMYMAIPIIKAALYNASEKTMKYWLVLMFIFASVIPFVIDLGIPYLSGTINYLNKYMEFYFVLGYTFYFIVGYYLSTQKLTPNTKRIIYSLGCLGFLYSLFVLILLRIISNSELGALNYLFPNIIFMGIAVFIFFQEKISTIQFSQRTQTFIMNLSKLTYGVFLIHVLILKALFLLGVNLSFCNVALSVPLISLMTFVVSLIIIAIISRIPLIGKYLC